MSTPRSTAPDNTAIRVALWRALHIEADAAPHVLSDGIGLQLVAPDEGWRRRGDMDARRTARARASIVARGRFIEDQVEAQAAKGVAQYVILGAGLDSFALRRPGDATPLEIYEIDQPATQEWKRERLIALGLGIPAHLHLVPVDFESGVRWQDALEGAGFASGQPAIVASSGVSMYLSRAANVQMLRDAASLAPGSTFIMTFMPPAELLAPEDRPARHAAERGAQAAGTPFVSYFAPAEILALAREAGFADVHHISADALAERYFAGREDGLRPSSAEELLIATC